MLALLMFALVALAPSPVPSAVPRQDVAAPNYPQGGLSGLIRSDDYPLGAVLLGMEGTVRVQVRVNPSGKVINCVVQQSSGFAILDAQTCRILQARARFEPAQDSGGGVAATTVAQRISWRIAETMPIRPWSFRIGVLLGADGGQTKCSIEVGGALKKSSTPHVVACADLGGGIVVPPDLARALLGNKAIVVFDRQFVPGVFHSINSPPDLNRFTLLGREVLGLSIGSDGAVTDCRNQASEGTSLPNPNACDAFARRKFTKRPETGRPLAATATVSVYSLRVH